MLGTGFVGAVSVTSRTSVSMSTVFLYKCQLPSLDLREVEEVRNQSREQPDLFSRLWQVHAGYVAGQNQLTASGVVGYSPANRSEGVRNSWLAILINSSFPLL